jgi:hypothetical protein
MVALPIPWQDGQRPVPISTRCPCPSSSSYPLLGSLIAPTMVATRFAPIRISRPLLLHRCRGGIHHRSHAWTRLGPQVRADKLTCRYGHGPSSALIAGSFFPAPHRLVSHQLCGHRVPSSPVHLVISSWACAPEAPWLNRISSVRLLPRVLGSTSLNGRRWNKVHAPSDLD